MAIDTEGFDEEVLAGADLDLLRPRLVIVELVAATDDAPRTSLIEWMDDHGYSLVGRFGVNGLFELGGI